MDKKLPNKYYAHAMASRNASAARRWSASAPNGSSRPAVASMRPSPVARSTRGETLAETLVGLLIAALSLVMLTTAIATASHIVVTTRKTTETYRQATNTLMESPASSTGPVSSVEITSNVYGKSTEDNIKSEKKMLPGGKTGITYRGPLSGM